MLNLPRMPLRLNRTEMSLREKLLQLNWSLIALLAAIACIGFATLYSAAGGSLEPWALKQIVRFVVGLSIMIAVAMVDLRFWVRNAYIFYVVAAVLLLLVEIKGTVGMGAQRWIDLGFIQLQPSEIMKITLILALARYFHGATLQEIGRPLFLIPPLIMVLLPAAMVMKQPDLGTAMMLVMSAGAVFFMAGVRMWKFALVAISGLSAIPLAWEFLREYQKKRVLIFLNPEDDPLGAGYHITQSKIALGSGGLFGKGYMGGTQSRLNFLPEKQTDFIFTMFAEEWGMMGGLVLLALYVMLVAFGYAIALRCRSQFGRLMALGITTTFFLYFFINIAMVMGLVPVVGVPLPLISYGGTAMLSLLFGWGLVMSAYIHRDMPISRRGMHDD
ncbi:rod shape-determining protein RodA [Magnetospirillum fulvum]|jgi:rod shape determining protein RodA|uniref:Peptidoglycan glycosyltransferase MrdB n=1 Tax=Magnetospirillum fulvum MGU-K5 TaxID=1316936 RepID=S9TFZ8_MAGFU|nr:rod shape-determining protein RodA [Magnetospirillum fulvum]EPY01181.1 cell division membrane protein [Magnetospirillum fulvum MGU-K5]